MDQRDECRQRASLGKGLHVCLHGCTGICRQRLLKLSEDFDALDGVDAEFGFHVLVQAQHVLRIACQLGNHTEQCGLHGNRAVGGGCSCGAGCGSSAAGQTGELCQFGVDGRQAAGLGEALHRLLHGRGRLGWQGFLYAAEHLDAFDGIDAQLGFHILFQPQHVFRVARKLRHGRKQQLAGIQCCGRHCIGGGVGRRRRCRRLIQFGAGPVQDVAQTAALGIGLHVGGHGITQSGRQ